MGKFTHKVAHTGGPGGAAAPVGSCPLVVKLEALVEYLCEGQGSDGKSRERASLLVVWEQGMWKGWLNDRDNGRTCWTSASTLTGLLEVIDAGLRSDDLDWRAAKKPGKGK
jgi:hypothetical protein